jgi:hypothetical protein
LIFVIWPRKERRDIILIQTLSPTGSNASKAIHDECTPERPSSFLLIHPILGIDQSLLAEEMGFIESGQIKIYSHPGCPTAIHPRMTEISMQEFISRYENEGLQSRDFVLFERIEGCVEKLRERASRASIENIFVRTEIGIG